ncbi:hypothetical protein JCM39194_05210 [Desulfotomaculum varum]
MGFFDKKYYGEEIIYYHWGEKDGQVINEKWWKFKLHHSVPLRLEKYKIILQSPDGDLLKHRISKHGGIP